MKPSPKHPEMGNALERLFGRTTAIESDTCAFCQLPATVFKDELSKKEYSISGLCQICQDVTFEK